MQSGGGGGEGVQSETKVRVCCTWKEIVRKIGPLAVHKMYQDGRLRYVGKDNEGEQLWEYEYSETRREVQVVWADQ